MLSALAEAINIQQQRRWRLLARRLNVPPQNARQGPLQLLGIVQLAVDRRERSGRLAGLGIVNRPGHVLAAAARRSYDQYAGPRIGRDANLLADLPDRVALADQLADVEPLAKLPAKLSQQGVQPLATG